MGEQSPWHRWYKLERWRKRAKHQLRVQPLCVMCLQRGELAPATIVDHIEPHRGDWNRFWLGAVQSLCKRCHDSGKKTEEARGYRTDIGEDGLPLDPRHPVYNR
jgi:hypothetical protein